MIIETLSTFPNIFDSYMNSSIMRIAQEKGILDFRSHNLRNWAKGFHKKTDDKPYGGGCGQLMMCEPIFKAYDSICANHSSKPFTIFLSPTGKAFNDNEANKLKEKESLLFICGHYEGIDQRAYTLADQTYSLGDYVLSSGELASMVIIDAVVRKLDGVLGAKDGAIDESFNKGLLEYPQYTRPAEFRGMKVPEILLSGDHKKIEEWKTKQSEMLTKKFRPDLFYNKKEENS